MVLLVFKSKDHVVTLMEWLNSLRWIFILILLTESGKFICIISGEFSIPNFLYVYPFHVCAYLLFLNCRKVSDFVLDGYPVPFTLVIPKISS